MISEPKFTKAEMYEVSGRVLANTATDIGIDNLHLEKFVAIHAALVDYDYVSEVNPDGLADPKTVADILGITDPTEDTLRYIRLLCEASKGTVDATTVRWFLDCRVREALACVSILRSATETIPNLYDQLWGQLGQLAVCGIMLDTVSDALDDRAEGALQFPAVQVMVAGASRFLRYARNVEKVTWRSVIKHSNRAGLTKHIVTKPIRIASGQASRLVKS